MNILDYLLTQFSITEITIYRQRNFENKIYSEVGKIHWMTRERIRQIEDKIEKKLEELSLNISISITK